MSVISENMKALLQNLKNIEDINVVFPLFIVSWLVLSTLYMQVGTALDTVEQLVEEQGLDPLFSDK